MYRPFLLLAALLVAPPAPPEAPPLPTTIYVVRHAERSLAPPDDPHLSEAGQARARRLAGLLAGRGIAVILSTDTRRTRETAAPLAEADGVPVRIYDPRDPASLDALLANPALDGGAVLVVGHSNTVPGIVERLSGSAVEPIADDEYGRLYRLESRGGGGFRVELLPFGG